jgi:hypothetical protein
MQQPDLGKFAQLSLPIKWIIPDSIRTDHATHLVVQQQGSEFTLFFFEAEVPLITGTAEEQARAYKDLKEIQAKCVGKIVMSAENIGPAANSLIESLNKFNSMLMAMRGEEHAGTSEGTELSRTS